MWNCPPSTILVPVDFGDASARALEVAGAVAEALGARLRVLHAESLEAPPYFTHEQLATVEGERKAARSRAVLFLADFARGHGASRAEIVFLEGDASSAIVEASRGVDLIVMGTHGRRGPSRWWLGSVAERVVHESQAPVLVVRGNAPPAPAEVFERPMVVAPPGAEGEAIRVATGLSRAFGGQVSDTIATCAPDAASKQRATMVVISKTTGERRGLLGHPVEQWLRSCALPMLFVPAPVTV